MELENLMYAAGSLLDKLGRYDEAMDSTGGQTR